MRALPIVISVFVTALVAGLIFTLSRGFFQAEELEKAEGRLSLYQSTVVAELERFSHLTFVLARDPFIIATSQNGANARLDERLRLFAEQAGLDAIYLMDLTGLTISSSNAGEPGSFLGQNYGFRPYFQLAASGVQGRFYGIGATTGLPGYFVADAVRAPTGDVTGVIAIKIDLSNLQESWREAGEKVMLSNRDGIVLLSSDADWRYKSLVQLGQSQRDAINASRQFPGQDLDALEWSRTSDTHARIGDQNLLHLTAASLPHDWVLHYFASDERAVALSWLVTASIALLAGGALVIFQVQRTGRIRLALAASEREELQLREANENLAREIEERRVAESQLRRAQSELSRSSRLAALGQLSASVTHELGQPIAAMRNHIAAAEIANKPVSGLLADIGGLVDRMEGITRQLKFFSRSEKEEFGNVDLPSSMHAAIALVQPNIDAAGVQVDVPENVRSRLIRGNKLRIEQVMTNLLRNAVDAVADVPNPRIEVAFGESDDAVWFDVSDNGHGLGDATLTDLREPFVTTRESGHGMGLGLAISAGIVEDHAGEMSAMNRAAGGATFRVAFPNPENGQAGLT